MRASWLVLIALAACNRKSEPTSSTSASPSTSPSPSTSTSTWPADIPAKPFDAKPGDRVFALHPHDAGASFDLCEIVQTTPRGAIVHPVVFFGGSSDLMTDMTVEHEVSGLVVARAVHAAVLKPKTGEFVLAYVDGERNAVRARVERLDGELAVVSYKKHDGAAGEAKVDDVAPAGTGVAPLTWVSRKGAAARVLVAGIDGETIYGVDEGGGFVKTAKADVAAIP